MALVLAVLTIWAHMAGIGHNFEIGMAIGSAILAIVGR